MTNKKSTKRALLVSAMAMVICFTMLLGTTFAWFTDSETNRNNIIKAGNLDVALEYYVGGGNWAPVEEESNLFNDNALWEPGYLEVAYLRIKNVGTLALNYTLNLYAYEEVPGTNVDDQPLTLSSFVTYDVIELGAFAEYDRAGAVAAVTDDPEYLSTPYTETRSLTAGSEYVYLAVIVYMPTTVDNAANYKTGTTAPSLKLGLNLNATQMSHEADEYGKDYDASSGIANPTPNPDKTH